LKYRPLICLALIHTLVDGYAQLVTPLWPRLKDDLRLDAWMLTALLGSWQLATSVSQPLFGYLGDRFSGRWMVAVGPALAIVCLTMIGFAPGAASLTVLLVAGGLGIGAFHPEAAVGVVDAAGVKATRGLALFTFAGLVGLGLGPVVSGLLTEHLGLHSLAWTMMPGLLLLGVLVFCRGPAGHPHRASEDASDGPPGILNGRGLSVLLLLAVATLRVVPALGVPLGLAFLLKQQGRSEAVIGLTQSLFLLSGGLGTLACPFFAHPGRELRALIATTLLASGFLILLTQPQPWAFYTGLVGSGFLLQGAIPLLIAYSQRLLPRGRRLAASLSLGASWGLGGILVAALQAYSASVGKLETMMWAMVPFAVSASLAAAFLPRLAAVRSPLVLDHVTAPVLSTAITGSDLATAFTRAPACNEP
jgi:FSR family fosmidomycin resistance protein-like MFS transporter